MTLLQFLAFSFLAVVGIILLVVKRKEEVQELWMNPGTGKLYIYNRTRSTIENERGIVFKTNDPILSPEKILEKVGEI